MRRSLRLALPIYLAVIAVPALALLYLEYRSVERQRRTTEALLATNLRLSGERLADEVERQVRTYAEKCLRDVALKPVVSVRQIENFADARAVRLQLAPLLTKHEIAESFLLFEGDRLIYPLQYPPFHFPDEVPQDAEYDRVQRPRVLVDALRDPDRAAVSRTWSAFAEGQWEVSTTQAEWFTSSFRDRLGASCCAQTRFLRQFAVGNVLAERFRHYSPLLENEVYPYGFAQPIGAQLFYTSVGRSLSGARILFVAVDMGYVTRALLHNARHVSGVHNEALLVQLPEKTAASTDVCFKVLFPFLRLRLAPEQTPGTANLYGFAAVTTAVLLTLVLGVVLLVRDYWRHSRIAEIRASFVAGVSHELKTPLTAIRLYADTLLTKQDASQPQREEFCRTIIQEVARLEQLVARVLDYQRIQRQRAQYALVERDLAATVAEWIERYRHFWAEQGFTVDAEIARDLPPVAHDAEAVAQMLLNLIDNAIRYSGTSRRIDISVVPCGHGVALEVKDFGIGIPPGEHNKIFEEFYRAPPSEKGGYGLGLFLVRHAADAHGGRVEVESMPSHGSTFRIIFSPCPKS
jgi:signal transduction histidine kinase